MGTRRVVASVRRQHVVACEATTKVMLMKVLQIWRYPVKSMGGERLDACDVTNVGLLGDRRWGVVDIDTGKVLTAKRDGRLLFAAARLIGDDEVQVRLPDGQVLSDDGQLSDWLGRRVSLQRAGESGGRFENPRDFEAESDWASWQGPPSAWHDVKRARVSLLSTGSLGDWDVRRFRPNVFVEGEGEGNLAGDLVCIGSTMLSVQKRLYRCVMVTRAQPGIEKDLNVLREINRQRDAFLAVGALVERVGRIAVGDELLTARPNKTAAHRRTTVSRCSRLVRTLQAFLDGH
jgi:uncharacterized protein